VESLEPRAMLAVSGIEQYFVYALNRARHAPGAYQAERALTVDLSYVQPRPPLAINSQLMNSSEFKSTEMATLNYAGHTSPTGETPNQLVRRHGYDLPYSLSIGNATYQLPTSGNQVESIAGGYPTADETLEALIVDKNTYPPGHRIHLLGIDAFPAAAREIGVGYASNSLSSFTHYWAIHATQSNDTGPYLTGVVFADGNGNSLFNADEGMGGVTVTAVGPTGTFTATSISAGGWTMKVPAGAYIVTASGGGFAGTSSAAITVGTDNVEVDFLSGRAQAWVNFTQYANAAPVLAVTSAPSLPPVVIGSSDPQGATVSSLLGTAFSDANPLASRGIAVTAATPGTASGAWQYSLDGGATWVALASPTATAARLLRAQDLLRFLPAIGSAPGTANLSYRAWDRTSGDVGATADTSVSGGSSAFSTAIAAATAAAVASNTAPMLDASGGRNLDPVAEDSATLSGTTVSQIVGTALRDIDPGTPAGIVVFATTGTSDGTWSYSLDDGLTWTSAGIVSDSSAIPLRAGDRLRFVPNADFNGSATVSYRGWDQSAGRAGVRVDLTAVGVVGGAGRCSTATATATAAVTPVNDSPVYVAGRSTLRLKPLGINPSFDAAASTTVSDLLGNCVTDVDAAAVAGIAIIGVGSGGSYCWSTDGNGWGGGTVSTACVTLLRGTDRLGFLPERTFSGESTITFRLWDQTSGTAGWNHADLSNPSQSTGGSKAFGADVLTARIFVGATDAPPTAAFGSVIRGTDGRSVASVPVTFSRAVEGFDVGDLRLVRDGAPVSLAGVTLAGSGGSFVIGNLGEATSTSGGCTLSILSRGSGITDAVGVQLASDATASFSVVAASSPPTDLGLSSTSLAENNVPGATIGIFSTVDPDAGDSFTYSLVAGTGSADNASFTINGTKLLAAAPFNYETKSSYSIRIRSTDQGGRFTEKAFTIRVTNVNEAPADVTLSSTSIAEDNAVGAVVGTFSSVDPDAANSFTYSLVAGNGSTDNTSFTISVNNLLAAVPFNFDSKDSYSIRVRSTDQGGLSVEKVFAIDIRNLDQPIAAPTVSAPASFVVREDTRTGLLFAGAPFNAVQPTSTTFVTVGLKLLDGSLSATTANGVTVAGTPLARTFTGTIAALNAYFTTSPARITYTPATNNTADRTLAITISEPNGISTLSSSATTRLVFTPVNDAPTLNVPAAFKVTEDFAGNLAWLSTPTPFADVDSPTLTVTLAVQDGVISASAGTGVTIGGSGTARTFTGTPAALNTYFKMLGKIAYTTAKDNTVVRTLTTTVSDGSLAATRTSTISITPVNDPPTIKAIATLAGAVANTPLEITYDALRSATNATDPDGGSPKLMITKIDSGTLQRWNGTAWVAVSTSSTSPMPASLLAFGQKLRWTPPAGVSGDRLAFKVKAWDGSLASSTIAQIVVKVA